MQKNRRGELTQSKVTENEQNYDHDTDNIENISTHKLFLLCDVTDGKKMLVCLLNYFSLHPLPFLPRRGCPVGWPAVVGFSPVSATALNVRKSDLI